MASQAILMISYQTLHPPVNWGRTAREGHPAQPTGDDLYPDNNGGVGVKCEHRAGQDKYIENQATNTNGQTDFNWTLKAATIPACQVHWGNPTFLRMLINYFTFNAHLQR